MTKEEIRHVSICKLHLKSDSVFYDVGSGTGSIAVEAASLSDDMEVYAIEQKENAVQLIMQNKEKHGLENIHVINAKARRDGQSSGADTRIYRRQRWQSKGNNRGS